LYKLRRRLPNMLLDLREQQYRSHNSTYRDQNLINGCSEYRVELEECCMEEE